jgi:UDP-N-acetylmuramoyl-tripeptide--D-alanyl-D-alanine ligase
LLYALAAYDILGGNPNDIQRGLDKITPNMLRQKFISSQGYRFYDDSYNSSPEAVIENMIMLSKLEDSISALLGDMLELGENSKEMHRLVGKKCAQLGFKKLYAFGRYAKAIANGAEECGMKKRDIYINEDATDYAATAETIRKTYEGETILVKGSHAIRLEKIIDLLCKSKGEEKC